MYRYLLSQIAQEIMPTYTAHSNSLQSAVACFTLILSLYFMSLSGSNAQAGKTFPGSTVLAPGDAITLNYKNNRHLPSVAGTYIISPAGIISLATIGEFTAAGKSLNSLKGSILEAFNALPFFNSNITVRLVEQNRFILMENGVRYPGWYRVPLTASLDELIAIAAGIKPGASAEEVIITRKKDGKTVTLPFKEALPLQSFDHLKLTLEAGREIVDNGDLLYVIMPREVTGQFSPTERNYFKEKVEVDRHGYIFLPTQGNIEISGFSTGKISEILTNNLPKYLSKSDKAAVNLIEKRHYIQILGQVALPGWYNIQESANIQAILSKAGGILDGANLAQVTITRKKDDTTTIIPADIQYYLSKGDNRMLPVLQENDTVFVPLAPPETTDLNTDNDLSLSQNVAQEDQDIPMIRIFGAVNRPGMYPAPKGGMDLLDLLITAEGENADADLSSIQIMRKRGGKEVFNMQALLDSTSPGEKNVFPRVFGNDIVHIARLVPVTDLPGRIVVDTETGEVQVPQVVTLTGLGSNFHGVHPFSPAMTPLDAIAQAGGLNEFADTNDIIIIRRVKGKQVNLHYNYDKALKGKEPDVDFKLEVGDIIYIP